MDENVVMKTYVVTSFPMEAPMGKAMKIVVDLMKDVAKEKESAALMHQTLLSLVAITEMMGVDIENNKDEIKKIQAYLLEKLAERRV